LRIKKDRTYIVDYGWLKTVYQMGYENGQEAQLWAADIFVTSTSIETGTRPHYGFAKILYDELNDIKPPVELGPKNEV